MSFRESGKKALASLITIEKNITIIEKQIFEQSNGVEDVYKNIIYEVLLYIKQGNKLPEIVKELKQSKVYWNHPALADVRIKQEEQDEFIVNPFQVEEGVLKCPKCSQSKTFSYSKQTRSADEPMTTFATCMNCKYKWTYSG